MYLIFLRKKAPMKRAHYLIQNCLQLDRSVLKKEVQVTNTAHGFLNMYWNVISSMLNQPID